MTESLKKSEAMCLKALSDMCDVLAKAMPTPRYHQGPMVQGIEASPKVPDYSKEQIVQARGGSEAPIGRTAADDMPQEGQELPPDGMGLPQEEDNSQEFPSIDPETAHDLSMYTPEHLHSIVQNASQNIARALMESIAQHKMNLDPGVTTGTSEAAQRRTTGKLVSSIRQPPRKPMI